MPKTRFLHLLRFKRARFKPGPAAGLMVADRVPRMTDPLFDPHLFRLSRFAENAPVTGGYKNSIAG